MSLDPLCQNDADRVFNKVVHVLPLEPMDVNYPFICAPGLIGSEQPEMQLSSLCAGAASAGTYCTNVLRPDEFSPCAMTFPLDICS